MAQQISNDPNTSSHYLTVIPDQSRSPSFRLPPPENQEVQVGDRQKRSFDFPRDVVEVGRDRRPRQTSQRLGANPYAAYDQGFSGSSSGESFTVEIDVVANIYAANQDAANAPINPGGNLNLVA